MLLANMDPSSSGRKTMTKPLAILKTNSRHISTTTKSSSTSSPLSSSSSSTASSSSSAVSPPTTIQTLIVRPSQARLNSSAAATPPLSGAPPPPPATTKQQVATNGSGRQQQQPQQPPSSNGMKPHHYHNNNVHIPSDILDDLASRFIINVPDDERNNLIRICFQIELAQWFYLDFFCANDDRKLMPCGMKQFAVAIFKHIPFLKVHLTNIDKILEDWKQYKLTVPTYGAILMSEDLRHVLLVQSFWAKSSWGFPKGKVNEHESPIHCATREVFEETGYDITDLIVQTDFIEAIINYQYTRLYLVRNVPLKTQFMPRTRKEIKCCEWFPIDSLPTNKNDAITKQNLGINANSFFMIIPFIKRLKKWVNDRRNFVGGGGGDNLNSSGGIYNFNNSMLSTVKKFDTKLSFKTPLAAIAPQQAIGGGGAAASTKLSNKRQRHKSMGDLDGSVNGSNLNKQRNQQHQLPQTTNDFVLTVEQQQQPPPSNNTKSTRNNNCKRPISNFGIVQQQQAAPSYPFDLIKQIGAEIPAAAAAQLPNTTKTGNKSNFIQNLNKTADKLQPLPPTTPQLFKQIKKQPRKIFITSSSSSAASAAAVVPARPVFVVKFKQVLAKSPNFNSWTNFSFSKNYITNVFC